MATLGKRVEWWALAVLVAAGCGLDYGEEGEDTDPGPIETGDDLVVEASQGAMPLTFSLEASGQGTDDIGDISLGASVGTVELRGRTLSAVAYENIPWESQGYTLFQVMAADRDQIAVMWLYCQGTDITFVYHESTAGGGMLGETASGSCQVTSSASTANVDLPALSLATPDLLSQYAMTGTDLSYDGTGPGELTVDGQSFVLLPFAEVDCRDCGGAGWWEVHSLLWDESTSRLCFTILYLHLDRTSQVGVSYSLTLPDLSDPIANANFSANWTRQ